jgi:hypothetical protein
MKGADLEATRRLATIVATIESRQAERFIQQALRRVNEEGIDVFVDRIFEDGADIRVSDSGLHRNDYIERALEAERWLARLDRHAPQRAGGDAGPPALVESSGTADERLRVAGFRRPAFAALRVEIVLDNALRQLRGVFIQRFGNLPELLLFVRIKVDGDHGLCRSDRPMIGHQTPGHLSVCILASR